LEEEIAYVFNVNACRYSIAIVLQQGHGEDE